MKNPLVESVKRVWVEGEKAFIEIRPHPESPQHSLEIATTSERSTEWFGKISLPMSPEYACALGEALIAAANEFK